MHSGYHGTEICHEPSGEWEDSDEAAHMLECMEQDRLEMYRIAQEAVDEWNDNGLETICDLDSFVKKRLQQHGYAQHT